MSLVYITNTSASGTLQFVHNAIFILFYVCFISVTPLLHVHSQKVGENFRYDNIYDFMISYTWGSFSYHT